MEFKIKVTQNDEGNIFATVFDEKNNTICISEGVKTPYKAVKNACYKLSNIMDYVEQKEDNEILEMIRKQSERLNCFVPFVNSGLTFPSDFKLVIGEKK